MNTARITYNGELRTTATHLASGNTFLTDAPADNHGKGEAFSSTDLIAAATLSSMITVIIHDKVAAAIKSVGENASPLP